MVRRLFLTPSHLPETVSTRCITLPDDAEWFGLLNAALLLMADERNYEQVNDTDLTAAEVAAYMYAVYEAYLGDECMSCCDDFLEYGTLPADASYRVTAGVPEYSLDGGTTWSAIPGEAQLERVPQRIVTPGADNDAKRCNASERATLVLTEMYRQTFGAISAAGMNVLEDVIRFLAHLAKLQIAEDLGPWNAVVRANNVFQDYPFPDWTEATLTADDQDNLRCLLYNYSTVSGGVVSFDWEAVTDNVITNMGATVGIAIFTLMTYIGAPGLNRAGDVGSAISTDCDCDNVWCMEWDFTVDDGGWEPYNGYWSVYVAGVGWKGNVGGSNEGLYVKRVFPSASNITRMIVTNGNGQAEIGYQGFNTTILPATTTVVWADNAHANDAGPWEYNFAPVAVPTQGIMLDRHVNGAGPIPIITKVRLEGTGENPFGADTCP